MSSNTFLHTSLALRPRASSSQQPTNPQHSLNFRQRNNITSNIFNQRMSTTERSIDSNGSATATAAAAAAATAAANLSPFDSETVNAANMVMDFASQATQQHAKPRDSETEFDESLAEGSTSPHSLQAKTSTHPARPPRPCARTKPQPKRTAKITKRTHKKSAEEIERLRRGCKASRRYREKKKKEFSLLKVELEHLKAQNEHLKARVEKLERDIAASRAREQQFQKYCSELYDELLSPESTSESRSAAVRRYIRDCGLSNASAGSGSANVGIIPTVDAHKFKVHTHRVKVE
jgi:hypothetical protein